MLIFFHLFVVLYNVTGSVSKFQVFRAGGKKQIRYSFDGEKQYILLAKQFLGPFFSDRFAAIIFFFDQLESKVFLYCSAL